MEVDFIETFKIYEAGKMTGISFEESDCWRKEVKDYFYEHEYFQNVIVINPNDYYNFNEILHKTEKEIIRFDLNKVRTSNLILVNLDGDSIGTSMELMTAHDLHIPIIGFSIDSTSIHPWIEYVCDRICDSMEEAIEYIEKYYLYE